MKNFDRWSLATLAVTLLSIGLSFAAESSNPSRQEEVLRKGADVMPFDLRRTTHFFDDTATGGIETVTANNRQDVEQIDLIRAHLAQEAKHFARGDFSDPAKIHGNDVPWLGALAEAGRKLRVSYKAVSNGASLSYSSRDKTVIAAIHEWFAAQRSDHDAHVHMHK